MDSIYLSLSYISYRFSVFAYTQRMCIKKHLTSVTYQFSEHPAVLGTGTGDSSCASNVSLSKEKNLEEKALNCPISS